MEARESSGGLSAGVWVVLNVVWMALVVGVIAAGIGLLLVFIYGLFGFGVSQLGASGTNWYWLAGLMGFIPGVPIWFVSLLLVLFTRGTHLQDFSQRFIGRWETRDLLRTGTMLLGGVVLMPFVALGWEGAREAAGRPEWLLAVAIPAASFVVSLVFAVNGILNVANLLRGDKPEDVSTSGQASEPASRTL